MGLVPAPVWTCWTCLWTSAGHRSSKETLEKCGVFYPVWTFWTSFRTSGNGTMRFGYMDRQGMIQPSAASDRQRGPECPDGSTKPPFFQCFLAGHRSRRGPAEVQQVKKMSRTARFKKRPVLAPMVGRSGTFPIGSTGPTDQPSREAHDEWRRERFLPPHGCGRLLPGEASRATHLP